jgi:hypothetical protein
MPIGVAGAKERRTVVAFQGSSRVRRGGARLVRRRDRDAAEARFRHRGGDVGEAGYGVPGREHPRRLGRLRSTRYQTELQIVGGSCARSALSDGPSGATAEGSEGASHPVALRQCSAAERPSGGRRGATRRRRPPGRRRPRPHRRRGRPRRPRRQAHVRARPPGPARQQHALHREPTDQMASVPALASSRAWSCSRWRPPGGAVEVLQASARRGPGLSRLESTGPAPDLPLRRRGDADMRTGEGAKGQR